MAGRNKPARRSSARVVSTRTAGRAPSDKVPTTPQAARGSYDKAPTTRGSPGKTSTTPKAERNKSTPQKVPSPKAEKRQSRVPQRFIKTEKEENEGSLEIVIPVSTMEAWPRMARGGKMDVAGSVYLGTKVDDEVHIQVNKKKDAICLMLKAAAMGSVFQSQLTKSWKCKLEVMHDESSAPREPDQEDPVILQAAKIEVVDSQEEVNTMDVNQSDVNETENNISKLDVSFKNSYVEKPEAEEDFEGHLNKSDPQIDLQESVLEDDSLINLDEAEAVPLSENDSQTEQLLQEALQIGASIEYEHLSMEEDGGSLIESPGGYSGSPSKSPGGVISPASTRKRQMSPRAKELQGGRKRMKKIRKLSDEEREILDDIFKLNSVVAEQILEVEEAIKSEQFESWIKQEPDEDGTDNIAAEDGDSLGKQEQGVRVSKNRFLCLICKASVSAKGNRKDCVSIHIGKHFLELSEYKSILDAETIGDKLALIEYYKSLQNERHHQYKKNRFENSRKQDLMECPSCKNTFIGYNSLRCHVMRVHKKDPDYLATVDRMEDMSPVHMQHRDHKGLIKCSYCEETRSKFVMLKTHMRMVHSHEPDFLLKLEEKKEEYIEIYNYTRRMKYHKTEKQRLPCRYCGEIFSFTSSRNRHEKFSCLKNEQRLKSYTCTMCSGRLPTQEDLDRHLAKHKAEDFKYVCDICGIVRRTKAGIFEHKRSKHSDKEPKYKCAECGKAFHQRDNYEKHITVHSDHRPIQCELCGNHYKTRAAVRKHQQSVHFNKYQFYCKDCGHGMQKLSYVKAHVCGRVRRSQSDFPALLPQDNQKYFHVMKPQVYSEEPMHYQIEGSQEIYVEEGTHVQIEESPQVIVNTVKDESEHQHMDVVSVMCSEAEHAEASSKLQYMMIDNEMSVPSSVAVVQGHGDMSGVAVVQGHGDMNGIPVIQYITDQGKGEPTEIHVQDAETGTLVGQVFPASEAQSLQILSNVSLDEYDSSVIQALYSTASGSHQ